MPLEQVRSIRNGYPPHTIEHSMASFELQLRDAEEKAHQAEQLRLTEAGEMQRAAQDAERKHQEQMAASQSQIEANNTANQKIVEAIRRLEQPHWTLTPTFWISAGILSVALITLLVAWLSWRFPVDAGQSSQAGKPSSSNSNSAVTPTNSQPTKPAKP